MRGGAARIATLLTLTTLIVASRPLPVCGALSDRHWDGRNPFQSPSQTTDYYGSGDLDLDGSISSQDVRWLREIIAGTRQPIIRADVDGSGAVNNADLALLEQAVEGAALPGWWHKLSTVEQRSHWMERMAAIDWNQLVRDREADQDWVCSDYALRCFLRFAPQVANPLQPDDASYGIAQSSFNLPVYIVTVTAAPFAHSMNAILIGDDPTVFTNWFFLEPQAGQQARAGDWNLPWGARVEIQEPDPLDAPYHRASSLVAFQLTSPEPVTVSYSTNLITRRPTPVPATIHNNPNVWQPKVLPEGDGMLLFNKSRDDLTRSTDLHLLRSLQGDPSTAQPLCNAEGFSLLLDTAPAGPGQYQVLWAGRTNWQQVLFYGTRD